jgi:hypothetical protein
VLFRSIERDIPVRRERVIPGYWYTVASARCDAELFDADNTQKYVAASKSFGDDSGTEGEKQMIERLAKATIGDAVAAIFGAK